jgi:hypothetical protein
MLLAELVAALTAPLDPRTDNGQTPTGRQPAAEKERTTTAEVPAEREDEHPVAAALPGWVAENFQRKQYDLLKLLWGQGEVPIEDVHKSLYKSRFGKEVALDKVKDRANKKPIQINQPYEITTRRGKIYVLRPIQ